MPGIDGGLRTLFRERLAKVHWTSIETGGTAAGVPDANGCINGTEFWVEFKQTHGWKPVIRPEQVGWISRRIRCGGRAFVAVRRKVDVGPRRVAADELYLIPGRRVRELATGGLQATLGDCNWWDGGPAHWDWGAVLATLECV